MSGQPGRSCPLHYRYDPADLCRQTQPAEADVLYVIGGLYGNPLALAAIEAMAHEERRLGRRVRLVFNGDFNWFNTDPETFQTLNERVCRHDISQGNVEYELAQPSADAGCGCAYPDAVDDAVVQRSNRIMARLQSTATAFPGIQARLRDAPRWRCYTLDGNRILVLHGDPESLAGWGLAREALQQPGHQPRVADWFQRTGADLIACTHTCLPALWQGTSGAGHPQTVVNNGSAGMGNLRGDHRGLVTRIARPDASAPMASVATARHGNLEVNLVPVSFPLEHWLTLFDQWWPAASDAALSYRTRIINGTDIEAPGIRL
ncbi:hypothetical protein [Marinobacter sp. JSM 1782161]|uniref:hypothetical protein n=1 Tax=Marinobacter sp. JSM 1782161 TaxID=2685906 RepID=UPI001403CA87|nr:hypothetical protein [Marinobacter sp. JSM 1782161]